jgi:ribonuclease P protein component
MTVFLLRADLPQSRLGVSATRKLGGAVVRNRAKRRFREAFRRGQFPTGVDIVVIPRLAALEASFAEVAAELHALVTRAARGGRSETGARPVQET